MISLIEHFWAIIVLLLSVVASITLVRTKEKWSTRAKAILFLFAFVVCLAILMFEYFSGRKVTDIARKWIGDQLCYVFLFELCPSEIRARRADDDARRKHAEEIARRMQIEGEARRRAEDEARRVRDEETRRRAAAEARTKAEEEAARAAETERKRQEAARRDDEERRRSEDAARADEARQREESERRAEEERKKRDAAERDAVQRRFVGRYTEFSHHSPDRLQIYRFRIGFELAGRLTIQCKSEDDEGRERVCGGLTDDTLAGIWDFMAPDGICVDSVALGGRSCYRLQQGRFVGSGPLNLRTLR